MTKKVEQFLVRVAAGALLLAGLSSCMMPANPSLLIPSAAYSQRIRDQYRQEGRSYPTAIGAANAGSTLQHPGLMAAPVAKLGANDDPRARLTLVDDGDNGTPEEGGDAAELPRAANDEDIVSNVAGHGSTEGGDPGYKVYRSSAPNIRDYNGPLSLGDPGVSASLWKETRGENDLFHDYRAWQPMDLITIVVTESSEGKKEADTEISSESSIQAAISNLFGLENDSHFQGDGKDVDISNLINADSTSSYKGEGETTRKGSLKARISGMVVEVLPSGVLRIEGEKIISVNNEEQIMIISGLVRPRDISSDNDVDSSKIANMRIDYFGRGTVGDAQYGGWLSNIIRKIWPF